jgi:hypothetical protein
MNELNLDKISELTNAELIALGFGASRFRQLVIIAELQRRWAAREATPARTCAKHEAATAQAAHDAATAAAVGRTDGWLRSVSPRAKRKMKMKTTRTPTDAELRKLLKAADEARGRVSAYSDEKRAGLEPPATSKRRRTDAMILAIPF